jgi:hypothetical protein
LVDSVKLFYTVGAYKLNPLIYTLDGGNGLSMNSKNESTKTSTNLATLFFIVFGTSICKEISGRLDILFGCSLN